MLQVKVASTTECLIPLLLVQVVELSSNSLDTTVHTDSKYSGSKHNIWEICKHLDYSLSEIRPKLLNENNCF